VELVVKPGAGDFSSDPALGSSLDMLRELDALGIADAVVHGTTVARIARRTTRGGRPRDPGEAALLHMAYVDSGCTAVQPFHQQLTPALLHAAKYGDRYPSQSELEARFAELEQFWWVFRDVKNVLVRAAVAAEPRIMDVTFLDPTGWMTPARLEHACLRPCNDAAGIVRNSAESDILAERWREVDEPGWGEDDAPSSTRTRQPFVELVRDEAERVRMLGVYKVRGHEYRSIDWTSGLRHYDTGTSWFGGYVYPLGSAFLNGEPIEAEVFPADVQEYDGYPGLVDSVAAGIGSLPLVVSTDAASSIRPFYEFNTRRGIAVLAPERKIPGKREHQHWRAELFDEDGVPRCRSCGGPGNQSAPGAGLTFVRGEPVIRYVCLLPVRPACTAVQQIACELEWLKLGPLSHLLEVAHAIRERHACHEHIHRHARQRYAVAGKSIADRLHRAGVGAQRLRVAVSLLLLWVRLCLRNGWLTPVLLPVRVNDAEPTRLSGRQDRRSLELREEGVGIARYTTLLEERRRAGIDLPYGEARAGLMAERPWSVQEPT
jgi:hypothetical protein